MLNEVEPTKAILLTSIFIVAVCGALVGRFTIATKQTVITEKVREVPIYKGEKIVYRGGKYEDIYGRCLQRVEETPETLKTCHVIALEGSGATIHTKYVVSNPVTQKTEKPKAISYADVCHGYPGKIIDLYEGKAKDDTKTTWMTLQPVGYDYTVKCYVENSQTPPMRKVGQIVSIPKGGISTQ